MKHKAKLSISRPSCSDGSEFISIRVEDEDAGITFLELEISYANFAQALTGLHGMDCDMEFRGLENVGKRQEQKNIEFKMPKYEHYKDRQTIAAKEAQRQAPEGWTASTYFGSRSSFFQSDNEEWARTSIYRWVEK